MSESQATEAEKAVFRAMIQCRPPYVDDVLRRSGMPKPHFDRTVKAMRQKALIMRRSAPQGEVIYPAGQGVLMAEEARNAQ